MGVGLAAASGLHSEALEPFSSYTNSPSSVCSAEQGRPRRSVNKIERLTSCKMSHYVSCYAMVSVEPAKFNHIATASYSPLGREHMQSQPSYGSTVNESGAISALANLTGRVPRW